MLVVLSISAVINGSQTMPAEISDRIDQVTWGAVVSGFAQIQSQANLVVMGFEIGACLCLCCPFFICHPVWVGMVSQPMASSKCQEMNRALFSGALVLACLAQDQVTINTDQLGPTQPLYQSAVQPAPVVVGQVVEKEYPPAAAVVPVPNEKIDRNFV